MMFWIIVALLTLLALAFVILPLLRKPADNTTESNALNITIHKKRLAELETDFKNGNIDEERYNTAREEIERDLLNDIENQNNTTSTDSVTPKLLAIISGVAVPIVALVMYFALGSWHNMNDMQRAGIVQTPEEQKNMPSVDEMVQALEARLEQDPNNAEGWQLLGRSYLHIKKFAEGRQAFEKAMQLTNPPTATLLTDYAEAIALGNELKLSGEPSDLLARALKINPRYEKAIWLSGFARYQEENYSAAIKHWKFLQTLLPSDSPDHETLIAYITQAEERSGISPSTKSKQDTAKIQIKVNVDLDDALISKVSSDDVVFVYAHAASGPRMPLAIVRKRADELPLTVVLDETMAMTPQMSLLNFPEVIINARISKSGLATPQSGDLMGQSGILKTDISPTVDIVINQVKE